VAYDNKLQLLTHSFSQDGLCLFFQQYIYKKKKVRRRRTVAYDYKLQLHTHSFSQVGSVLFELEACRNQFQLSKSRNPKH